MCLLQGAQLDASSRPRAPTCARPAGRLAVERRCDLQPTKEPIPRLLCQPRPRRLGARDCPEQQPHPGGSAL